MFNSTYLTILAAVMQHDIRPPLRNADGITVEGFRFGEDFNYAVLERKTSEDSTYFQLNLSVSMLWRVVSPPEPSWHLKPAMFSPAVESRDWPPFGQQLSRNAEVWRSVVNALNKTTGRTFNCVYFTDDAVVISDNENDIRLDISPHNDYWIDAYGKEDRNKLNSLIETVQTRFMEAEADIDPKWVSATFAAQS